MSNKSLKKELPTVKTQKVINPNKENVPLNILHKKNEKVIEEFKSHKPSYSSPCNKAHEISFPIHEKAEKLLKLKQPTPSILSVKADTANKQRNNLNECLYGQDAFGKNLCKVLSRCLGTHPGVNPW